LSLAGELEFQVDDVDAEFEHDASTAGVCALIAERQGRVVAHALSNLPV